MVERRESSVSETHLHELDPHDSEIEQIGSTAVEALSIKSSERSSTNPFENDAEYADKSTLMDDKILGDVARIEKNEAVKDSMNDSKLARIPSKDPWSGETHSYFPTITFTPTQSLPSTTDNLDDISPIDIRAINVSVHAIEGTLYRHVIFRIESQNIGTTVLRRYSDFVGLWRELTKIYRFRIIPKLPPKKFNPSSDAEFIEERRKALRRWLLILKGHHAVGKDLRLVMFLERADEWSKIASEFIDEGEENNGYDELDSETEAMADGSESTSQWELMERSRSKSDDVGDLMYWREPITRHMERLVDLRNALQSISHLHKSQAEYLGDAEFAIKSLANDSSLCPCINETLKAKGKNCSSCQETRTCHLTIAPILATLSEVHLQQWERMSSTTIDELDVVIEILKTAQGLIERLPELLFGERDFEGLAQRIISWDARVHRLRLASEDEEADAAKRASAASEMARAMRNLQLDQREFAMQKRRNASGKRCVERELDWMHGQLALIGISAKQATSMQHKLAKEKSELWTTVVNELGGES